MATSMPKMLEELEKQKRKLRGPAHGKLVMPPILPVDEWEALAMPQQEALAQATRAGVADDKERK